MTSSPVDVIYEDDSLRVEAAMRSGTSCTVTFTPWTSSPPATPFGATFLDKLDRSRVYFIAKDNHWYSCAGMGHALSRARDLTRNSNVITYGSSMGGWAAIAFAGRLGASESVAISPQATIDRAIVPWETRWAEEAALYPTSLGTCADHLEASSRVTILYDPLFELDARHVELIARSAEGHGVDLRLLRFAFSGHPSGPALADAGILTSVVKALLDSQEIPPDAQRIYRQSRMRSRSTAIALLTNRRIRRDHPALLADIGMAYRRDLKWDGKLAFFLARVLNDAGRFDEALRELPGEHVAPAVGQEAAVEILRDAVIRNLHRAAARVGTD